MKVSNFLPVIFLFFSIPSLTCTLGVAIGEATSDGRPLLWKTRDYEVKQNIIFYKETGKYPFISNVTPAYGYYQSWYGVNEKGFAIANTFISDFPEGNNGLGNGDFMNFALSTCATVNDFIALLDSTNLSGRTTRAVFGVIDTTNAAMIFEVNADHYWKFDAHDKTIAPDGYIIRTNFTISNGGTGGIERYKRSLVLVNNFYKNGKISKKDILQSQMRDIVDSNGNPVSTGIIDCNKNICRPSSISATVIQGVKNSEPGYLTTMWAMLGNPFTSIAVPYWPVGQTPEISRSDSEKSLYSASLNLKKFLFDSNNNQYVDIQKTISVLPSLFETENKILDETGKLMKQWRNKKPEMADLLQTEINFSSLALKTIQKITKKIK
ncbi:MAG: hypothetical protein JXR31_13895 [Prolixibacteraceae bacterium]|nr:hypothetical protein [Prolixibacteraceae bacterium]